MTKEKKLSLRLSLLAGLALMALLGSTAGSLAWYAFSRTVSLTFVGTSVATSSLLNVGLVDTSDGEPYFDDDDLVTYNLEREEATEGTETKVIYWSKSRTGISLLALRHYLEQSPYAVDKLHPVTTGSREALNDTHEFKLFRSPEVSEIEFEHEATTDSYCVLPLAFRVINEDQEYVASKNIWLTDAAIGAEHGVENSVRMFVQGSSEVLVKPADNANQIGETKVGGVLSLGPGEYYDYDNNMKEYCYGEFETPKEDITYSALEESEYDVLDNMNGVSNPSEQTTFYAKHHSGVLVPDIDGAVPKVQKHYGIGKIKPSVSSEGEFYVDTTNENGVPIATTTTDSKIAFATFTIFVEGWDHSIIDQNAGYSFNLDLKFEIDRI